jgi:hypothetical protein
MISQIRDFLSSNLFYLPSEEIILLSNHAVINDDIKLSKLMVSEPCIFRVVFQSYITPVDFRYDGDFNYKIRMFFQKEITVGEVIEKWSSLLKVECWLIKISRVNDEKTEGGLFEQDLFTVGSGEFNVSIVSSIVRFCNVSGTHALSLDIVGQNPICSVVRNLIRNNGRVLGDSIRLLYRNRPILENQNLCRLETTQCRPIVFSWLNEYKFTFDDDSSIVCYFSPSDTIAQVRGTLVTRTKKNVIEMKGYYTIWSFSLKIFKRGLVTFEDTDLMNMVDSNSPILCICSNSPEKCITVTISFQKSQLFEIAIPKGLTGRVVMDRLRNERRLLFRQFHLYRGRKRLHQDSRLKLKNENLNCEFPDNVSSNVQSIAPLEFQALTFVYETKEFQKEFTKDATVADVKQMVAIECGIKVNSLSLILRDDKLDDQLLLIQQRISPEEHIQVSVDSTINCI